MAASYLKPSLNSSNGLKRFSNDKRLSVQKKKENLMLPMITSLFFIMCIVAVPENPSNLASICEKYNSSFACQVW